METESPSAASQPKTPSTPFRLVSLQEERLERKFALAFGFMSFVPILLIVWARFNDIDLNYLIFPVVGSALIGYLMNKRMVNSIMKITDRARALSNGQPAHPTIGVASTSCAQLSALPGT